VDNLSKRNENSETSKKIGMLFHQMDAMFR